MFIIGIDENGLGPLLGPLVVTAAAFETPTYAAAAFFRRARRHLPADDSKRIFGKNKWAEAEWATLSWLKAFGVKPTTHRDLLARISAPYPLYRTCEKGIPPYCTPSETPLPCDAEAAIAKEIVDAKPALAKADIRPVAIWTLSVCPGSFNHAVEGPNTNKFILDFSLMMHLAAELRSRIGSDVEVICGKVGSTRRYGKWFEGVGLNAWWVEEEQPARSTYRVNRLGKVSFIRDGDATDLPIAVASMVGKYVRELAMKDLNARLAVDGVPPASGYHNKATFRFVSSTEPIRKRLGLCEGCFLRNV